MNKLDRALQKAQDESQILEEKRAGAADRLQAVDDYINGAKEQIKALRYKAEIKKDDRACETIDELRFAIIDSQAARNDADRELSGIVTAIRDRAARVDALRVTIRVCDYRRLRIDALKAWVEYQRAYMAMLSAAGKWEALNKEQERRAAELHVSHLDNTAGIIYPVIVQESDQVIEWCENQIIRDMEIIRELEES